ncbi:MAG TPA: nicotinate phosphoribosyltransferase, partial [Oscillospiraceae bacterium]|nr:nicotinate phosphoribosyltransferase [Oscillospiraceae bacterium]
ENEPYELFDPDYTWKRKTVENFIARPLLQEIFKEGKLVYRLPSLDEIRDYCTREIDSLWEEVLRFENPHKYYVDLSQALWDKKQETIAQHRKL